MLSWRIQRLRDEVQRARALEWLEVKVKQETCPSPPGLKSAQSGFDEACLQGVNYGTEHLLGLPWKNRVAAQILTAMGVIEDVREQVMLLLGAEDL